MNQPEVMIICTVLFVITIVALTFLDLRERK
jgi:hypothetical protein